MHDAVTPAERRAMATLCAALPALREQAEQALTSDDLEWSVEQVNGGAAALPLCRELGLLDDAPGGAGDPLRTGTVRPGSSGAQLFGLAEVTLPGDYRCPTGRCARRDRRDQHGRPPTCALSGTPMAFRSGAGR